MVRIIHLLLIIVSCDSTTQKPKLNYWSDTPNKEKLLTYIEQVTNKNSTEFIPINDRVAVFDNDGTLWSEYPLYFPFVALFDFYKDIVVGRHKKNNVMVDAVIKKDINKLSENEFYTALIQMQAEVENYEYEDYMVKWLQEKKHSSKKRPYFKMTFKPMLELIRLLESNEFKVYIVTGGGSQFARALNSITYKIPRENIIGTTFSKKIVEENGKIKVIREAKVQNLNDKEGKVLNIIERIGRVPVMAFGNSDGDLAMIRYTSLNSKYKSFTGLVRHDDDSREFVYDRESKIGRLNKGLDQAPKYKINILSMKSDFKVIYEEEK